MKDGRCALQIRDLWSSWRYIIRFFMLSNPSKKRRSIEHGPKTNLGVQAGNGIKEKNCKSDLRDRSIKSNLPLCLVINFNANKKVLSGWRNIRCSYRIIPCLSTRIIHSATSSESPTFISAQKSVIRQEGRMISCLS